MRRKEIERIAIVGGGIAGMFCAFVLSRHDKQVWLFEEGPDLGGRIKTVRLNQACAPGEWKGNDLEFFAEFGPMRLELDKQWLVKALLDELEIREKKPAQDKSKPHLIDFPSYSSPPSRHDPQYVLQPEEAGKTPLALLRMAFLRIIVQLDGDQFGQQELARRITLASAVQQPVDPIFQQWVRDIGPEAYWRIQRDGSIAGVPLYAMGFWNLLSDHLSHGAVNKIRDLGTFYHLLPENPNAAEWLVWWLVGLGSSEKLKGVFGGMSSIVERLEARIPENRVHCGQKVVALEQVARRGFRLHFDNQNSQSSRLTSEERGRVYDRVILALPKRPLKRIVERSGTAFAGDPDMPALLDSAFAFPMVKVFIAVKNRWWEEETLANRYATRAPTREVHYWKGRSPGSRRGLIMGYSDRPATSFWANYVPPGAQERVYMETLPEGVKWKESASSGSDALPVSTRQRLLEKVAQYMRMNDLPDFTIDDIAWYGIRDWGREPYGGANHAWRPERRYWVVMRRLGQIGPHDRALHICGEAYSDYHGFIEGSLRSASYVLHRILDIPSPGRRKVMPWLDESNQGRILSVDARYLQALRAWARNLDEITPGDSFTYEGTDGSGQAAAKRTKKSP